MVEAGRGRERVGEIWKREVAPPRGKGFLGREAGGGWGRRLCQGRVGGVTRKNCGKRFGLYPACLFSKLWHKSKCLTSLQNCFQILLPLRPPAFFFFLNCFETSRRLSSASLFVQVASNRPLWHENVRISCGTTGAALGGWVSIDKASNSLSYLPRGGYYLSDHRLREKWNGLMVELIKRLGA